MNFQLTFWESFTTHFTKHIRGSPITLLVCPQNTWYFYRIGKKKLVTYILEVLIFWNWSIWSDIDEFGIVANVEAHSFTQEKCALQSSIGSGNRFTLCSHSFLPESSPVHILLLSFNMNTGFNILKALLTSPCSCSFLEVRSVLQTSLHF